MKPLRYELAESRAEVKSASFGSPPLDPSMDFSRQVLPQVLFDYLFQLQVQIEKGQNRKGEKVREARMDYREYAKRVWVELIGLEGPFDENDPVFVQFQSDLVLGLHHIDQSKMVYESLRSRLPELVAKLHPTVKKAILWSTGDVDATGYQVLKIAKSGVIGETRAALNSFLMDSKRATVDFKSKTDYLVADDKHAKLRSYLEAKQARGDISIRLAVIEDSRGNLDKVKALVHELFGDAGVVVPIWAMYSREGRKAFGSVYEDRDFDSMSTEEARGISGEKYIPIRDLADLIDDPDIISRLQGAELLIDFDGVIADNILMRNAQSQVKMAAIKRAMFAKRGMDEKAATDHLLQRLSSEA